MLTGMQEEQTGSSHRVSKPRASSSECHTDPPIALVGVFLDQMISPSLPWGCLKGGQQQLSPLTSSLHQALSGLRAAHGGIRNWHCLKFMKI